MVYLTPGQNTRPLQTKPITHLDGDRIAAASQRKARALADQRAFATLLSSVTGEPSTDNLRRLFGAEHHLFYSCDFGALLSLRATICAEIDSGVTNDDHAEFSRNVCTT